MWLRSGLKLMDDDLKALSRLLETSCTKPATPNRRRFALPPERVSEVRTALFFELFS